MTPDHNTILITGGGSGIGRGLAEALQAAGNRVIITGRQQAKLDETTGANAGMQSAVLDVTDAGAIEVFAERITAKHPALNVLINNAGVMKNENLKQPAKTAADREATVVTNLLGPLRLTAALLPHLLKQPRATIINVSSGLAFLPLAMTPTYCATKAALHSYTQSLRFQLRDTAVEVIELAPPYVQTGLMGARQASDPHAMPLKDFIAETMSLLRQSPTPAEICVERVKPLRTAERSGNYDRAYREFNERMLAARATEM